MAEPSFVYMDAVHFKVKQDRSIINKKVEQVELDKIR